MSDEYEEEGTRGMAREDEPLSMGEIARLDAALDKLTDDQRPHAGAATTQEVREHLFAAQLRLARDGAETPTPAFLAALEHDVARGIEAELRARRRPGLSRGRFLRAAATFAGGAGVGVAGVEGVMAAEVSGQPHDLIVPGNERWYAIAAVGEIPLNGVKPFQAGGVQGYLFNTDGRLHAVSSICTHMGCRVKPDVPTGSSQGLHCLCHGSRFDRQGTVVYGLAPAPLPTIALRVEQERVYALGTKEDA